MEKLKRQKEKMIKDSEREEHKKSLLEQINGKKTIKCLRRIEEHRNHSEAGGCNLGEIHNISSLLSTLATIYTIEGSALFCLGEVAIFSSLPSSKSFCISLFFVPCEYGFPSSPHLTHLRVTSVLCKRPLRFEYIDNLLLCSSVYYSSSKHVRPS